MSCVRCLLYDSRESNSRTKIVANLRLVNTPYNNNSSPCLTHLINTTHKPIKLEPSPTGRISGIDSHPVTAGNISQDSIAKLMHANQLTYNNSNTNNSYTASHSLLLKTLIPGCSCLPQRVFYCENHHASRAPSPDAQVEFSTTFFPQANDISQLKRKKSRKKQKLLVLPHVKFITNHINLPILQEIS